MQEKSHAIKLKMNLKRTCERRDLIIFNLYNARTQTTLG